VDRIAMADARQILLSQADPGGQPRRWFAAVLVGAALWMGAMPLPQLRAAELRESEVPQPLRSWVPWVLQDHETIACPAAYNDGDRHECVWACAADARGRGAGRAVLAGRRDLQERRARRAAGTARGVAARCPRQWQGGADD